MTIIPPKGMKPDLARNLINNDSFAHMWLVHNGLPCECSDGCDQKANPVRVKQYMAIITLP